MIQINYCFVFFFLEKVMDNLNVIGVMQDLMALVTEVSTSPGLVDVFMLTSLNYF